MTAMTSTRRPARRPARPQTRLEWGPAKHDPEHPCRPVVDGHDLRDADAARPDDN